MKIENMLWVAVAIALVITIIAVATRNIRQPDMDRRALSRFLDDAIADYKAKHGYYPETLSKLAISNWPERIQTNYLKEFSYTRQTNGCKLVWQRPGWEDYISSNTNNTD